MKETSMYGLFLTPTSCPVVFSAPGLGAQYLSTWRRAGSIWFRRIAHHRSTTNLTCSFDKAFLGLFPTSYTAVLGMFSRRDKLFMTCGASTYASTNQGQVGRNMLVSTYAYP